MCIFMKMILFLLKLPAVPSRLRGTPRIRHSNELGQTAIPVVEALKKTWENLKRDRSDKGGSSSPSSISVNWTHRVATRLLRLVNRFGRYP
jgi:hypothetical protein